jgi:hypothetical protein
MKKTFAAILPLLTSLAACAPGSDTSESALSGKPKDATLTFDASWNETPSGPVVATTRPHLAFDPSRLPTCRGEQGGIQQWAITAHYRLNGGDEKTVTVAGLNAEADPRIDVPEAGDLEVWFQATNRWGCVAYDSNFGQNYHFVVVESAVTPKWMGNVASVVSRSTCDGGACEGDRVAIDQGVTFDTWGRQRAAVAGIFFDVWRAGVTDFDNPDLWKELDVEVHLRPKGAGAFETRYVDFSSRHANDARYELPLRSIDPLGGAVTDPAACPAGALVPTPDGQYVETTIELYFTVNGKELRPAPGKTYEAKFVDYRGSYDVCLPH